MNMKVTFNNLQLTVNRLVNCQMSIVRAANAARGQALITLLFFTVFAMTITSGAVAVLFSDSLNATRFQQGLIVHGIAQSGAENAILRLLRDSSYSGEILPVGSGNAEIQVVNNGGGSYTILSKGTLNNFMRKIQIDVVYNDELLTEVSRKEVY